MTNLNLWHDYRWGQSSPTTKRYPIQLSRKGHTRWMLRCVFTGDKCETLSCFHSARYYYLFLFLIPMRVRVTHAMHKHLVFVLLHNGGEAITKIISICSCCRRRRRCHRMDKQFGFKINRTAHVHCSVSVLSVLQHHRVEYFHFSATYHPFGYCLFTHSRMKKKKIEFIYKLLCSCFMITMWCTYDNQGNRDRDRQIDSCAFGVCGEFGVYVDSNGIRFSAAE